MYGEVTCSSAVIYIYIYTGCFRRNSKYFRRWYYELFQVNTFILTCVQISVDVEIQLF